jgi:hypothetical protein
VIVFTPDASWKPVLQTIARDAPTLYPVPVKYPFNSVKLLQTEVRKVSLLLFKIENIASNVAKNESAAYSKPGSNMKRT